MSDQFDFFRHAPAAIRAYHDHMGVTNGRLVAVGAVGSALIVLVISGTLFRGTIAESWFLWRLESAEPRERRTAIRALAAMGSERSIPLFGAMMLDSELEPFRRELLRALVAIGPVAADTIATLMEALPPPPAASPAPVGGAGNQPAPEHFDVVKELVDVGPGAVPALVAAVVSGFSGGDVELARRAGVALADMEQVEGPIADLLGDPDPAIRRRTAFAVGWAGIARSALVPPLASMLTERASEVRAAAAYAFRSLGKHVRSAVPQLMEAFGDEDEDVSRQAIDALVASGVLGKEAVAPLLGILQDASQGERVHSAAARGLGALGPLARAAVPHLVSRVQAASGTLDFEVVLALGRIGPDARAAVPVLLEEVGHEDRLVRLAAVEALGRIAPGDQKVARRLRPWIAAADEELVLAVRKALGINAMEVLPSPEQEPGPQVE